MILVDPIKIKALFIYPQRYGRSQARILKSKEGKRSGNENVREEKNNISNGNFNAIKKF